MKAIKAAILAAVMTFQLCGTVLAASSVSMDNWEISYTGGADSLDRSRNFIELSNTYYFEGETSAAIKNPDAVSDGALELSNTLLEAVVPGTYTVSFYISGTFSKKYIYVKIGDFSSLVTPNDPSDWTVTNETGADGKTWYKYTQTIDYASEAADKMIFSFAGYTNGCRLDNVSLIKEATGEELVQNPGFEDMSENLESDYNSAEYDPVNVMAFPFSGGLAIGWKNPSTSNLKKIELYEIKNGEEIFISDEFDTTPQEYVAHKITKLTDGNIYQYKVRFSYYDGAVVEYFTFGSPSSNNFSTTGWSSDRSKGELGYCPTSFMLDSNESYDGEVSLKYVANIKNTIANVFGMLIKGVGNLEQGENYRLSFWMKADNNRSDVFVYNNWAKLDGNSSESVPGVKGTYDWKEFNIDITESTVKSLNLFFVIPSGCDALWFDNFSLYKMVDGERTGDNLMSNGSFEDAATEDRPDAVKNLKAVGGDETVKLSWTTPGGITRTRIYELTAEGYIPRGYVSGSVSEAVFTNLHNDMEYSFGVTTVDSTYKESEMQTVDVMTVSPDFKVYAPEITVGTKDADVLEPGNTYTVITKVKNYRIEEPVPVTQMVALYRGDVLVGLKSQSKEIKKAEQGAVPVSLKSTVTVPDDGEQYHLEIFTWDSKQGMKSLYNTVLFE